MRTLSQMFRDVADTFNANRGFTWPYPSDGMGMSESAQFFGYTSGGQRNEEAPPFGFSQIVNNLFRSNAVVFACEMKRLSVFSEVRFLWRPLRKGRPDSRLFGTAELGLLEHPWPRGTTGDLLLNMLMYADLGGNAFVMRDGDRLRILRPDWVTIVMGDTAGRPVESPAQLDAEIIGFVYDPKDGQTKPEVLMADEVAHWAPIPDPLARFRGMSWMTPIIREVQADTAATVHKQAFFENGAALQTVVSFDSSISAEQFKQFVPEFDQKHKGWRNAYKTLYLGGGADVKVIGADMAQLDFSNTQGKGETRIAAASGIHPVLIPLSEGLSGSSLNAGNYAAARDSTSDMLFRPLWRGVCGALEQIMPSPGRDTQLWYDESDVAFLQRDVLDLAEIRVKDATAIEALIRAGYEADSVRDAVLADDYALLKHAGLISVQQQPAPSNGSAPPPPELAPAANGTTNEVST